MLNFLKQEANKTVTENGALTYKTTESACLDFFAVSGALRKAEESRILDYFKRSWTEDKDLTMKILFYTRDIRGGLGERRIFRLLLSFLANQEPETVIKNLSYIPEYGRYDDLLVLLGTPSCRQAVVQQIRSQLESDKKALEQMEHQIPKKEEPVFISLLAKWLPSINASNKETVKTAKFLAKSLSMCESEYRHLLSALRCQIRIIENYLRTKDYTFDYEKQPSKAMYKYRKAFIRNDKERYQKFIENVGKGKAVLNAKTLYPYEVIEPILVPKVSISKEERQVLNATWTSLPDYTSDENSIVVVDGSGSMYCGYINPKPISVALSLGIYFAEHNKGVFHNHFITFSETPQLAEIKGNDIYEKVQYCSTYNEIANTNLFAVFELILRTAINHHIPQEELPSKIYIISDMEFDSCTKDSKKTNFEAAKLQFKKAGYQLPDVVFWNVASRNTQQPVKQNELGVSLVSGCSPSTFQLATLKECTPYTQMLEILQSERYAPIHA